MDEIGAAARPPGTTYEWAAMSYQETVGGDQIVYVFGLAIRSRDCVSQLPGPD